MLLSLLGLGAISAIVGSGTMGTLANFTATNTNPGQSFAAGTLRQSNNGTSPCTNVVVASSCGTLTLTSNSGMSAGDMATGTVTITNSGSLPATMSFSATVVTPTSGLEAVLNLTVFDQPIGSLTGTCVYGTGIAPPCGVSGAPTVLYPFTNLGPISLPGLGAGGRWNANESHTLTVTVEVENNAGTVPANKTAGIDFTWNATQ